MVSIYQADTTTCREKVSLSELLKKLPYSMHGRALRYRSQQDAYDYIIGRLLLRKGLMNLGLANAFERIEIAENGKPFLENVFFNISHTSGLLVCAISTDNALGIDVEARKELDLSVFEDWFRPNEWQDIQRQSESMERFFWYWTRKESIIKALGWSLSDLNQLDFDANVSSFEKEKQTWYLQDLDFGKDYWACLCSTENSSVQKYSIFEANVL